MKKDYESDCISRADARKAIIDHQYSDSFCEEHSIDHSINTGMALIALSDLPPATPQEPKSEWEHDHEILKAYSDGVQDTLGKIRAEIEKAVWEDCIYSRDGADEVRIPRLDPDDVFEIIDKYKAEGSDEG